MSSGGADVGQLMIDIRPAADRTAQLVTSVADEQLDLPTPCPGTRLGDLIDHVGSLSRAFLASARKETGERDGPTEAQRREPRSGVARPDRGDLHALADAWQEPEAWEGSTKAGGIDLPAEVAGLVVLDELVVHGWDIAVASGQRYQPAGPEVDAAMSFVGSFEARRRQPLRSGGPGRRRPAARSAERLRP